MLRAIACTAFAGSAAAFSSPSALASCRSTLRSPAVACSTAAGKTAYDFSHRDLRTGEVSNLSQFEGKVRRCVCTVCR